ncbi:hypothetical protein HEK616_55290 [Streptomyces nigrescens]|uniref:Uncharacterized protein n=2 Tax=Streptomyces TaxID=1883 RepID=A0ABM8A0E2_STRNI|nr:hypothetical protein [Streptomyces nigrescens]MEE4421403.1 hypothetical protein [Streptomyces sp. DSM 41528]BDM72042.1 hypothetical protein HEK616_55290 [Streptomyces nigrescens]
MYQFELELRVRQDELRREAARQRLAREAIDGRRAVRQAAARSGSDEPEGRVSTGRARRWRVRRATA